MILNLCFKASGFKKLFTSKMFMVMKLTYLILTIFCIQASAAGYAQQISLSEKKSSLSRVFSLIEKQSGYTFFYKGNTVKNKRVSVEINNATIEEALNLVLNDQSLTYAIVDKIVIIKPKEELAAAVTASSANVLTPVKGKVVDKNGRALAGVNIRLRGATNVAAVTDTEGNYQINLPDNQGTLIFTFVGFVRQEIAVNHQAIINVQLVEEETALKDVVVVGYGTQKKVDLSGSVSSINYDQQLQNRPITDISQAISGQASGVSVSQTSGQPGKDGAVIRIRGIGTLNDSNPLVLVDGVVGSLNDVNPNDVASISVLKDAASAAIYGSRAANGVILVTTKRGKKGQTVISYNAYAGISKATHLFKPVTDYPTYMGLMNGIQKADNPNNSDQFPQATIDAWRNATDRTLYPNTDWMKVIFGNGSMTNHNLSVRGGDDKTNFYLSANYLGNQGIISSTDSKKYSLRLNLDHKVSEKVKIGGNLSYYWNQVNEPFDVTTLLYYGSNSTPGTTPKKVENGEVRYGGRNTDSEGSGAINPLQYIDTWFYPQKTQYSFGKLYAEWDILKDLKWEVDGSATVLNTENKQYKLSGPIQNLWNFQKDVVDVASNATVPSVLNQRNDNNLSLTFYSTLNYSKTFNTDHHLTVLLGTSREKYDLGYFSGSVQGFPSNDTWELNAGLSQPMVAGTTSSSSLSSYFGRANYNFQDKYLFEANLRYDGSSRFADGNRWGLFPSFSAAWRLSQEKFFQKAGISFINDLKFRASWGRLGNQNIGLYQYMGLYSAGLNYIFGNSLAAGLAPTALSNPAITWESTTTTDLGADVTLFGNHLDLTFDYYNRKTNDILVQLPLSSLYGALTAPYQNVGIVQNKGWELSANYKNHIGEVEFAIGGNLSYNTNKVLHFQGNPDVIQSTGNNSIIKEGLPINAIYGYQAAGTFKNQAEIDSWAKQKPTGTNKPGDLKYVDLNHDGVINGLDRTNLGNVIPKYSYGFTTGIGYKGLQLNALFQGISGVSRFYQNLWYTTAIRAGREINSEFLNSWSSSNPTSNIPRLTTDNNGDNTQPSSFWVQSASYLRLKNLQLAYSLPTKWLRKTFLTRVQVYANGQNLFTWTKYNGLDPETSNYTDYQIENPNIRIISFGLNTTF